MFVGDPRLQTISEARQIVALHHGNADDNDMQKVPVRSRQHTSAAHKTDAAQQRDPNSAVTREVPIGAGWDTVRGNRTASGLSAPFAQPPEGRSPSAVPSWPNPPPTCPHCEGRGKHGTTPERRRRQNTVDRRHASHRFRQDKRRHHMLRTPSIAAVARLHNRSYYVRPNFVALRVLE